MFSRTWQTLPPDSIFPDDLNGLGYYINDIDEIRSITNPSEYFEPFESTTSVRCDDRRRFAFNGAVRNIIHERLEALGLDKLNLPLETVSTSPRVPIFASRNIADCSRVIAIVGEIQQDLGVISYRVAGGRGGVDVGSMVSVVRAIQTQQTCPPGSSVPGIIIANPGELWWWPEGKRGLTPTGRQPIQMRSIVHEAPAFDDSKPNMIPRNETARKHIESLFEAFRHLLSPTAKIDIMAVTDMAEHVEQFLDNAVRWSVWGDRMNSISLLGAAYRGSPLNCAVYKRFLRQRGRAWVQAERHFDTVLAGPRGNRWLPALGCPVFSGGLMQLVEALIIFAQPAVLKWIQEVADKPGYANPDIASLGNERNRGQ